ncbi:MAG: CbtB domain-containing protein [Paracoccaceae bacterium]
MTTTTQTATKADLSIITIAFVAFMGLGLLFVSGLASAASLHDSAHDIRHMSGFPCH